MLSFTTTTCSIYHILYCRLLQGNIYFPAQHVLYIVFYNTYHIFLGKMYQILSSTADTIYCVSSAIGTMCIVYVVLHHRYFTLSQSKFNSRHKTLSSTAGTRHCPQQQAKDIVLNSRHKTLSSIAGTRHCPKQHSQDIVLNSRHKSLSSTAGTRHCHQQAQDIVLNSRQKTLPFTAGKKHCPRQQAQDILLNSTHKTLSSIAGTRQCPQQQVQANVLYNRTKDTLKRIQDSKHCRHQRLQFKNRCKKLLVSTTHVIHFLF